MKHFYFDMDGVLVVFDEDACVRKPFNVPGSHYFRTCPADTTAVDIFTSMAHLPVCDVNVLTRLYIDVPDDALRNTLLDEHGADKEYWCRANLGQAGPRSYAKGDGFVFVRQALDKTGFLLSIPEWERGDYVLVDDDPVILARWVAVGGKGVQYIQKTRNVRAWDGLVIRQGCHVPNAVVALLS